MTNLLKQAIKYVAENRTWSDTEDERAYELIGQHYPLPYSIEWQISDLMEEFSDEHDLPEGWWLNETDEEEIFLHLND